MSTDSCCTQSSWGKASAFSQTAVPSELSTSPRPRGSAPASSSWSADQVGADLPEPGGHFGIVGDLVGGLGLAVGEELAGDALPFGRGGQVDWRLGALRGR